MTPFQTFLNQCQTMASLIRSESETQNSPALKDSLQVNFGSGQLDSQLDQHASSEWVLIWTFQAGNQTAQVIEAQKEALFDEFCVQKVGFFKQVIGSAFYLTSKSLAKGTLTIRIPFGEVDVDGNIRRALQLSLMDAAIQTTVLDGVSVVNGNQVHFKSGSTDLYIERVKKVIEAYGGVITPAKTTIAEHYSLDFIK